MNRLEKNLKIKATKAATKEKRKEQDCRVYELKINLKRSSKSTKNHLSMMFIENKWIYNFVLEKSSTYEIDAFKVDYQDFKTITHRDSTGNPVEEEIKYLSSQMKQDLFTSVKKNICALSKMKKAGLAVGRLKFKQELNSIPLKQYGVTYRFKKDKLYIQGIKECLQVHGLHQLDFKKMELANAQLVKFNDEFYLKVTTYQQKQQEKVRSKDSAIGIDFGIKDAVILSTGEKFNWSIPESKRLKKLQTKKNFQVKGSNGWNKTKKKINAQYKHQSNQKKDLKNKFVHDLCAKYDYICIQNDNINGWKKQKWNCKTIQHSIIGAIKAGLKLKSGTLVVDQFYPSTQLCSKCGNRRQIGQEERTYHCTNPVCGLIIDRDLNSALNILKQGLLNIPVDDWKSTLVESTTESSLKQENRAEIKSRWSLPCEDALLQRA